MTFGFKNTSEFLAFGFGQNMFGKWRLSKNSKMITLNTGKDKLDFEVFKLTETELIFKLGLGKFAMKKN